MQVSYRLSFWRHWQKTAAITLVLLGSFFGLSVLRRAWDADANNDADSGKAAVRAVKVTASKKAV